jgi:hypothetical protein
LVLVLASVEARSSSLVQREHGTLATLPAAETVGSYQFAHRIRYPCGHVRLTKRSVNQQEEDMEMGGKPGVQPTNMAKLKAGRMKRSAPEDRAVARSLIPTVARLQVEVDEASTMTVSGVWCCLHNVRVPG